MSTPRILVGVDGSAASQAALLWAAGEARRCGGELVLVHVWEGRTEGVAPYAPVCSRPDPEQLCADGHAVVERAATLARESHPGVPIRCHPIRGRPAKVLACQAVGADLLVLGSGAQQAGDGRLGAVLLACLRRPPCPIVVVHTDRAERQGNPSPPLCLEAVGHADALRGRRRGDGEATSVDALHIAPAQALRHEAVTDAANRWTFGTAPVRVFPAG